MLFCKPFKILFFTYCIVTVFSSQYIQILLIIFSECVMCWLYPSLTSSLLVDFQIVSGFLLYKQYCTNIKIDTGQYNSIESPEVNPSLQSHVIII